MAPLEMNKPQTHGDHVFIKVEASITDHLRDFALDLDKYKAMQNYPMREDKNQEDCNFVNNSIPWMEITMNFWAKCWPQQITNVQSLS